MIKMLVLIFSTVINIVNADVVFQQTKSLAKTGDRTAQFELGGMYHHGIGTSQSINKAIKWYTRSAEQRHSKAQLSLGMIYFKGKLITQDFEKALYWWKLSAKQKNPISQFMLAMMYYKAAGIKQDFSEAITWFTKAARLGHKEAAYKLGIIHFKGQGMMADSVKSFMWFYIADALGRQGVKDVLDEFDEELSSDQIAIGSKRAKKWLERYSERIKALDELQN